MKENIDPKMHTAEHILNQTMVRLFGTGRCFSAHIERKKSKCDYHFDRPLSADEMSRIEDQVNEVIVSGVPVLEEFMLSSEARMKFKTEHLPSDLETIRIIKVGDYDAVPCSGPHVQNTKELDCFKIISSDYNDGVLRIRYKLV
jgi:alanyl-tRNA synthetase